MVNRTYLKGKIENELGIKVKEFKNADELYTHPKWVMVVYTWSKDSNDTLYWEDVVRKEDANNPFRRRWKGYDEEKMEGLFKRLNNQMTLPGVECIHSNTHEGSHLSEWVIPVD